MNQQTTKVYWYDSDCGCVTFSNLTKLQYVNFGPVKFVTEKEAEQYKSILFILEMYDFEFKDFEEIRGYGGILHWNYNEKEIFMRNYSGNYHGYTFKYQTNEELLNILKIISINESR